ncbi:MULTISPECIES: hypothetical protein [Bacteroides]|jgi:hypothetical protein|uniref:hypothetical protein n=1 Tax=Bacteroides TaxID=816 RepID=UPI000B37E38A|nr:MULTISPECIES: hypothetical protein [Bacteroides]MBM6944733.1 hypothetical protein [Bacteroides gallinaceum]OUP31118.1 hypothetical protein B5F25_12100 [Bacteroides sp. An19]
MENEIIRRLEEYMAYAGLNDNQVTVQCGLSTGIIGNARKKGRSLNGSNIVKILYTYKDLNARWFLTGEGEMLSTIESVANTELSSFLKIQNKELQDKVERLNREIGDLQRQLSELKKANVHQEESAVYAAASGSYLEK